MQSALEKLRALRLKNEASNTTPLPSPVPRREEQSSDGRVAVMFHWPKYSMRTTRELAALVNEGWAPLAWADRLEQLAAGCESLNPELAAQYRKQAAKIREVLGREQSDFDID